MKKLLTATAMAMTMAASASAAVVNGGETTVTVLFDIVDNNLTATATGDAQVSFNGNDQPVYEFDITGDELNEALTGTITHSGGARFAAGGSFIELNDFTFDLTSNQVFADLTTSTGVNTDDAYVFNLEAVTFQPVTGNPFDDIDNVGYTLNFRGDTLDVVQAVLGGDLDFADGQAFGLVAIDPEAVPIPGAALLFAPAAAGLWMRGRKRRKA